MTDQQPQPPAPDLAPQPSPIALTPATVEACQADYKAAAAVRAVMDKQQARQH